MTAKNAKDVKNKSIESVKAKADKVIPETKAADRALLCKRECEIPFVGSWKGGETITDQVTIEKIGDNPNFELIIS